MIQRRPKIDRATRQAICNASDEIAAKNGCRFDAERGLYVVDWIEKYLRLYEGEYAGQPFICGDWQREALVSMFGWIRHDPDWSRIKGRKVWVRRFNQATIWIPKKNGKSPTLAALGLYLTCGDGEQGAKSFFFAKDGSQAREIAGRHSVEMLRQSPELMSECEVNKTTLRITHLPSRSFLQPLSSGDDRHQQAREGLNGNILVDEVHVVDQRLMDRVSRAGISRAEPFQIEVSTAGNNPDSYGKTRFEYSQAVLNGDIEDERLYVAIHAAPQEITDAELDEDPVKFGKLANPTWGRIIREKEYIADYQASKRGGASEFSTFKMYRLNVWQRSANPLINLDAWRANEIGILRDDLAGRGGSIGIDLSRAEDMSSVVFSVPGDKEGEVWQYPLFWMTRAYAEQFNHLVKFLDFARAGDLKLVDGSIRDEDILPDISDLIALIEPTICVYDATYAEFLAETIAQEHSVDIAKFPQTYGAYSNPTIEYVNAISDGRLKHDGNTVMSWQAGHVMGKRYAELIKPIKDDKQRHRKIDGIQAAIMSLHGFEVRPKPKASVYETRGPLVW